MAQETAVSLGTRVKRLMSTLGLKSVPALADALGVPKAVLYEGMKADREGQDVSSDVLGAVVKLELEHDVQYPEESVPESDNHEGQSNTQEPMEAEMATKSKKGGKSGGKADQLRAQREKQAAAAAEKGKGGKGKAATEKPARAVKASKTVAPAEGAVKGLTEKPEDYGEMQGRTAVELNTAEHGLLRKQRAIHKSSKDGVGYVLAKKHFYSVRRDKDGVWRTF